MTRLALSIILWRLRPLLAGLAFAFGLWLAIHSAGCASVTYQSAGPARVRLDPADKQAVQVLDSEGKVRCEVRGKGPVVVEPGK